MSDFAMHADQTRRAGPSRESPPQLHLSVQILSTLLYGGFAITSVAIAFDHFWPGAMVLAAFLAWRGGFAPAVTRREDPAALVETLREALYDAPRRHMAGDGPANASFLAYRDDVMDRLEREQQNFDGFLGRLRDAKDQSEFDRFMEERAEAARQSPEA